jgi:translation initiation factor IF-3
MAGIERHYRTNREITAPRLRLVDGKGGQIGVVDLEEALRRAEEARLDLVEVAPEASPPVCRLMDFGKFRYMQQKHEQAARKRQHVIRIKEVKFHLKIAPNDYRVKVHAAQRFLTKGDKVKLVVALRGREVDHTDLGLRLLDKLVKDLSAAGTVEHRDENEDKFKTVIITPKLGAKVKG